MSWTVGAPRSGVLHRYRFVVAASLLGAAILLGVFQRNLLVAAIIGLTVLVFLLRFQIGSRSVRIAVGAHGVRLDDHVYSYQELVSFWIDHEPAGSAELSLEVKRWYLPYLKVPLANQDPHELRAFLAGFLPEREHESSPVDVFLRRLGH